ncbi:MAG: mannose-1-phosphate guanylyltransferase/mannose-6-phosphate isomerase [Nitrospira sp.]|nr:mannose-1-phosphate guanylyltransferase/mannose-6-phosphate isomerase [Nitrospira sp.]
MYAVILAGGSGTRFWPLSRELYPKQFLKISGPKTLLEQTVHRLSGLVPLDKTYLVANGKYVQDIKGLFPASGQNASPHILVEPIGKNTAPAIGLAAIQLEFKDPEAVMAVFPADHLIKNIKTFTQLLKAAVTVAQQGSLVTLGIKPTSPETGYGYIRAGSRLTGSQLRKVKMYLVDSFVEKPNSVTAERYFKSRRYFWNSGIFIWKASAILKEMERFCPDLYKGLMTIKDSLGTSRAPKTIEQAYAQFESVSIDYGVMEKARRVVMIEADIGWTDLGSWTAVGEVAKANRQGNIIVGNVLDLDSSRSVVYADKRLVATIGLENMIVVDSPDATLVCPKDRAQDVKKLVDQLKKRGAQEQYIHRTVYRPWGSYTVLEEDQGYKIKRLEVKPGARLSLQLHNHRSEHWVVVSGVARVTCGERVYDVKANESTYIPMGTRHRIENPGNQPLQIIEVQNGSYLGEDDIVRFDDDYGRIEK